MKRIKWVIMTLAIVLSIGGAFATKLHQDCGASDQYYLSGSNYVYAGIMGVNYVCMSSTNTCTYYLKNGVYTGCQAGDFSIIGKGIRKPNSK